MKENQLVFVYNAGSGLFESLTDFAHKILSPSTYDCKLCALTYGNFSMKQEWKSFIESLPVSTVFLHKDEFEKKYREQDLLPAVFLEKNGNLQPLISKKEIEACTSLEELMDLVERKINHDAQRNHTNLS